MKEIREVMDKTAFYFKILIIILILLLILFIHLKERGII